MKTVFTTGEAAGATVAVTPGDITTVTTGLTELGMLTVETAPTGVADGNGPEAPQGPQAPQVAEDEEEEDPGSGHEKHADAERHGGDGHHAVTVGGRGERRYRPSLWI